MIKKTMTYKDFNDVERTEDFYFNLTEAEVTDMEMSTEGGFGEKVKAIINAKNVPEIIRIFKYLIEKSYGVKSDDGRRFIKTKETFEAFSQTSAYSDLFMELATDSDAAAAFVNGIFPKKA